MTVHPEGIPLIPVGKVADADLTNVPVGETPETQDSKQPLADVSVANIFI